MEVKKSPTNPTSSTLCVHCAPQSSMTLRTTDGDNKQIRIVAILCVWTDPAITIIWYIRHLYYSFSRWRNQRKQASADENFNRSQSATTLRSIIIIILQQQNCIDDNDATRRLRVLLCLYVIMHRYIFLKSITLAVIKCLQVVIRTLYVAPLPLSTVYE